MLFLDLSPISVDSLPSFLSPVDNMTLIYLGSIYTHIIILPLVNGPMLGEYSKKIWIFVSHISSNIKNDVFFMDLVGSSR
jgi:hypothetical protein